RKAISSPLLDISIDGARGILFAVSSADTLTLSEIHEAAKIITESVDPEAKIIFGAFHDETLNKGELKITVIAAGFPNPSPNIIASTHPRNIEKRIEKFIVGT
ncbi:MAG: cell division protein FtsZ, partial [Parcubacteria group bacterium LiPW_39]